MTAFFRVITFALQHFWRNVWLSVITVSILVLALFSVNVLLVVNVFADAATKAIEQKVDVTVFFTPESPEEIVLGARKYLLELNQVRDVEYISKDEALQKFKAVHADDTTLVASLAELEENPLGPELIVRARDVREYPFILKTLDHPDFDKYITKKNFEDHRAAIDSLSGILAKVRMVGFALIALFGGIGVLIVFNTIKVALYTHREEIGIMKLVGASNLFIRAPYWIESIFFSLLAVLVTVGLMYSLSVVIEPFARAFFAGVDISLVGYFMQHALPIFGAQFLALSVLNILSSSLAINRYLRV